MTGTGSGAGAAGLVDVAQLRARQEHSRRRIAAVQARALEARAALADETASATSTDRSVTVTVNPGGALVDLTFGPSAHKLPLPALARTVLATYRQATGEAVAHTQTLLRDLLGDDAGPALGVLAANVPNVLDEGDEPMTGFHVDPEAIGRHAAKVDAIGSDVGDGAAAEVTGAGQPDFGVLIGNTLGFGIRALAQHFEQGLEGAAQALGSTADGLRGTADTYRQAETSSDHAIKATAP